jgi:vancomycin permeability regulator SanA
MEVIVVLGSPNFPDGTLGPIALDRLQGCLSIFNSQKHKILCTGGFGAHFNTSPVAHANYLKDFLILKGVPSTAFLPLALSSNTVEDAVMSKSILMKTVFKDLIITTSEYHVARVEFIFTEILKDFNLNFKAVAHHSIDDVLEPLIQHEKVAMDKLISNGLYY